MTNPIRDLIHKHIVKRDPVPALLSSLNTQIDTLRKYTDSLTPYADISGVPTHIQMLNLAKGKGFSVGLHKELDAAIAVTTLEHETVFPYHEHDEVEHIVVISGEIEIVSELGIIVLHRGESLALQPNMRHCAFTKEVGCKFIAITIPANSNYPESK